MNETDTLRGLILLAKRKRDKSLRQLAFDAQAAGHKIVGTTLSGIEKGTYKSVPSIETIRAIGWLAGVGDDVSFAAAGQTPPGPPFADELPPGVDDLSPKERRAAIEVLRALIAQRQEINRYESAAALSSPPEPRTSGEAEREIEEAKPQDLILQHQALRDDAREYPTPDDGAGLEVERQSDYELVRGRKRDPRVKPEISDDEDWLVDPEGPEDGA